MSLFLLGPGDCIRMLGTHEVGSHKSQNRNVPLKASFFYSSDRRLVNHPRKTRTQHLQSVWVVRTHSVQVKVTLGPRAILLWVFLRMLTVSVSAAFCVMANTSVLPQLRWLKSVVHCGLHRCQAWRRPWRLQWLCGHFPGTVTPARGRVALVLSHTPPLHGNEKQPALPCLPCLGPCWNCCTMLNAVSACAVSEIFINTVALKLSPTLHFFPTLSTKDSIKGERQNKYFYANGEWRDHPLNSKNDSLQGF